MYGCGTGGGAREPQCRYGCAAHHHSGGGRVAVPGHASGEAPLAGRHDPPSAWIRSDADRRRPVVFHPTLVLHDTCLRVRLRSQCAGRGAAHGAGTTGRGGGGPLRRMDGGAARHGAHRGVVPHGHRAVVGIERSRRRRFTPVVAGSCHLPLQLRLCRRGRADDECVDGRRGRRQ